MSNGSLLRRERFWIKELIDFRKIFFKKRKLSIDINEASIYVPAFAARASNFLSDEFNGGASYATYTKGCWLDMRVKSSRIGLSATHAEQDILTTLGEPSVAGTNGGGRYEGKGATIHVILGMQMKRGIN